MWLQKPNSGDFSLKMLYINLDYDIYTEKNGEIQIEMDCNGKLTS